MLRVLWVRFLAIAGVLGWGWDASLEAAPMFGLEGQGTTGPGGWNLTIAAQVSASGATGFAHLLGGVTGPVTEIIPPTDDPGSFWCFNILRTDTLPVDGDQRANIYIRDIGDGITTFDQVSFVSGIGVHCSSYPTDNLFFLPLVQGDFKAEAVAATVPEGGSAILMFALALFSVECGRRAVNGNRTRLDQRG